MFAKNSGREKSRNKKRARGDEYFNVQDFIAETFTNLNHTCAKIWEKNIQSTVYIATLTAHLAAKIGITDRNAIQKFLRGFLLEDRQTAQLPCDHFTGSGRDVRIKVDQFAKKLEFLKNLYETINQPEALLGLFLLAKQETVVVEMTKIVKKFDEYKFNYEFLHDWLAVYLFFTLQKKM